MRISSDPLLTEIASSQASRAQEAARTYGTAPGAANPGEGGNGDSAEISGLSTRIMDALAVSEAKTASRVAALSALYARGEYVPNATELSRALISHALGGGAFGEE